MTQPDTRLADWIGEGPETAPTDLLELLLHDVDRTPQRHPIWSWPREGWGRRALSLRSLLALAAVIVVVAAIAVPRLTSMLPPSVGPGGSASPSPSSSPAPPTLPAGSLEPGAYRMVPVGGDGPAITFTVDDDWEACCGGGAFAIRTGTEADPGMVGLTYWMVDTVYLDPCRRVPRDEPVGPSAADLAAAFQGMSGIDATGPEPTRLRGRSGVYLELTVRDDIGCEPGAYTLWTQGRVTRYAQAIGELDRLWIFEVDGRRVVIDAVSQRGTSASDRAALDRVVESIRLDPP